MVKQAPLQGTVTMYCSGKKKKVVKPGLARKTPIVHQLLVLSVPLLCIALEKFQLPSAYRVMDCFNSD